MGFLQTNAGNKNKSTINARVNARFISGPWECLPVRFARTGELALVPSKMATEDPLGSQRRSADTRTPRNGFPETRTTSAREKERTTSFDVSAIVCREKISTSHNPEVCKLVARSDRHWTARQHAGVHLEWN